MKDIDALMSYISAVTDLDNLNEVMELLKHSLEVPGDDHGKLFGNECHRHPADRRYGDSR